MKRIGTSICLALLAAALASVTASAAPAQATLGADLQTGSHVPTLQPWVVPNFIQPNGKPVGT